MVSVSISFVLIYLNYTFLVEKKSKVDLSGNRLLFQRKWYGLAITFLNPCSMSRVLFDTYEAEIITFHKFSKILFRFGFLR